MKHFKLTLLALFLCATSFGQIAAIAGPGAVCIGSTITLTDATPGGTWSTSPGVYATAGSSSGTVTGIMVGVETISYTVGASYVTYTVTVEATPSPITGPATVCVGNTVVETFSPTGGVWSITPTTVAALGSLTGLVTGIAPGTATITYALGTGCAVARTITVDPSPAPITGPASTCAGGYVTLSDITPGGFWVSSTPTVATVGSTGVVTGYAAGTANISYVVSTGCYSAISFTVNPVSPTFTVTGGGAHCAGSAGVHIGLSGSQAGSLYFLSHGSGVDTIVTGTGSAIDFGIFAGAATYTVIADYGTPCAATMTGSVTITINPLPAVYTLSFGGGGYCMGGGGARLTLSGSQVGVNYQLFLGASAIGSPIAGTGAPLDFGLMTMAGAYSCIATYTVTGCSSVMTTATLTVFSVPATYSFTGGGTYCTGGTITLGLAGSEVGVNYQLYISGSPVGSAVIGTGLAISFGTVSTAGTYTVIATNSSGCTTTTSTMVLINPLPTVYTVTGGGSLCSGGTGFHIILSGSDAGISYQLYRGGTPVGTPFAGTGSSLDFGIYTTGGTYIVVATDMVTACSNNMSGTGTISILSIPTAYAITGGGYYCTGGAGATIGLSNSQTGVDYQLYDGTSPYGSAVAGAGAAFNFPPVTALGTFTVAATNATTGCINNMTGSATVSAGTPPAVYSVTGGGSYCSGSTGVHIGMSNSGTGVNYQLYNGSTSYGSPDPGTGAAIDFGLITPAGTYTVTATNTTTGCTSPMTGSATVTVALITTPSVSITASPGTTVCTGTTVSFTATAATAGTSPTYAWYVNGTATGAGGTYSYIPLTGDVVSVIVTSSDPCAIPTTASTSVTMTIDIPAITTSSSGSCGGIETINAGGGIVYTWLPTTGLSCSVCGTTDATPSVTTIYTVTGTDSYGCSNTTTVTVDGNRISGYITYTGTSFDTLKVWLIQFNPSDSSIMAEDSVLTCMMPGGNPFYEFMDAPAGNYLVKAKLYGTTPGASGYIPTYGISTPNWYSAATIAHTSSMDTMHINMIYGTVPPGPGFISGFVVSGAGRGTSGEIPEPGMLVYLMDGTGVILTSTYTDAAGAYAFNGLANGDYIIYPENYKYYTTATDVITLNTASPSATGVGFKKHTSFGTITPYTRESIAQYAAANETLTMFPVPTTGILNIASTLKGPADAAMKIRNMQGREVFGSLLHLVPAPGQNLVDLNYLPDGVYHVTINASGNYYTEKLVIAH